MKLMEDMQRNVCGSIKIELESNFYAAKQRLSGLKSKLFKIELLFYEYKKILNEQSDPIGTEECKFNENEIVTCYMPCRLVTREDKSTNKVRFVCFI